MELAVIGLSVTEPSVTEPSVVRRTRTKVEPSVVVLNVAELTVVEPVVTGLSAVELTVVSQPLLGANPSGNRRLATGLGRLPMQLQTTPIPPSHYN